MSTHIIKTVSSNKRYDTYGSDDSAGSTGPVGSSCPGGPTGPPIQNSQNVMLQPPNLYRWITNSLKKVVRRLMRIKI